MESAGESTVYLNGTKTDAREQAGTPLSNDNRVFLTVTNCGKEDFCQGIHLFMNPYYDWCGDVNVMASSFWKAKRTEERDTGQISWKIVPNFKSYCLRPEESFSILIDHINCWGDRESMICLGLALEETGEMGYIPVFQKYHQVMAKRFVCSRNTAGVLDQVKFEWETQGNCTSYLLPGYGDYGGTMVEQRGSLTRTVFESTNFALLMKREEFTVYAKSPVTVLEPQILLFWADQEVIRFGTSLYLNFRLKNTYHCYIDRGIGRLEGEEAWSDGECVIEGSCLITPRFRENVYTLSVLGKETVYEAKVTVTIQQFLQEAGISFSRAYENGRYSYQLIWNVENCTEISLKTTDSREWSQGRTKGSCSFHDTASEALKLTVELKGYDGQSRSYTKTCDEAGGKIPAFRRRRKL